jgi:hypothetical protein
MWHPRASGTSKKGGNLVFGVQYARVIGTTWYRVSRAGQDGRLQSRNGSAAPQ